MISYVLERNSILAYIVEKDTIINKGKEEKGRVKQEVKRERRGWREDNKADRGWGRERDGMVITEEFSRVYTCNDFSSMSCYFLNKEPQTPIIQDEQQGP